MRKAFVFLTAAAFALSLASAGVAQEKSGSSSSETKTTTTTTTKTTKSKAGSKVHRLTGTVESIDAAGGTFTLKPAKGEVKTFKAGEKVKLDSLSQGDKVTVSYKDNTATSVKAAKGKKSSKKGASTSETTTTTTTTTPAEKK
jgi:NMD protein affecting ribosome stability and mRNA decay